jgi:hypothetical protein
VEDLDPSLRAAIRQHLEKYKLGDLEAESVMCTETTSVRQKQGLFGKAEHTLSAAFVTPQWLVWADSTDRNAAGAGSARLTQIEVHNFETSAMGTIAPDEGLNITGRYTDSNKTGITFIALASGPDGQKFRQVLREAKQQAEAKKQAQAQ